jgi:hypothetical protein
MVASLRRLFGLKPVDRSNRIEDELEYLLTSLRSGQRTVRISELSDCAFVASRTPLKCQSGNVLRQLQKPTRAAVPVMTAGGALC